MTGAAAAGGENDFSSAGRVVEDVALGQHRGWFVVTVGAVHRRHHEGVEVGRVRAKGDVARVPIELTGRGTGFRLNAAVAERTVRSPRLGLGWRVAGIATLAGLYVPVVLAVSGDTVMASVTGA